MAGTPGAGSEVVILDGAASDGVPVAGRSAARSAGPGATAGGLEPVGCMGFGLGLGGGEAAFLLGGWILWAPLWICYQVVVKPVSVVVRGVGNALGRQRSSALRPASPRPAPTAQAAVAQAAVAQAAVAQAAVAQAAVAQAAVAQAAVAPAPVTPAASVTSDRGAPQAPADEADGPAAAPSQGASGPRGRVEPPRLTTEGAASSSRPDPGASLCPHGWPAVGSVAVPSRPCPRCEGRPSADAPGGAEGDSRD